MAESQDMYGKAGSLLDFHNVLIYLFFPVRQHIWI